jgi:hypothetical protein
MTRAPELAQALVDYDERVAQKVLDLLVQELGGTLDGSPPDSESITTSEWKEGLAAYERLRSLARELERLLP